MDIIDENMLAVVTFCRRAGPFCQGPAQGLSLRKASRFLNITSRPYTTRAQNVKDKIDLYVKPLAFTVVVCCVLVSCTLGLETILGSIWNPLRSIFI